MGDDRAAFAAIRSLPVAELRPLADQSADPSADPSAAAEEALAQAALAAALAAGAAAAIAAFPTAAAEDEALLRLLHEARAWWFPARSPARQPGSIRGASARRARAAEHPRQCRLSFISGLDPLPRIRAVPPFINLLARSLHDNPCSPAFH